MKITLAHNEIYSSDHKVELKANGELKHHDPAGEMFTVRDDDGKATGQMGRCLMGSCEYRTKSGTVNQVKTWIGQHLSAKH